MKLTVLVVLFMTVSILGFAGSGYADCSNFTAYCYANAGNGSYLGNASCPCCYKWYDLSCEFCGGDASPANHCNGDYSACQGNCWGCSTKLDGYQPACWDNNGNCYGAGCSGSSIGRKKSSDSKR
ncbi:MAG: hypothetical protein NTX75_12480 [Proteobacteria bacterium]|nr:hypothetical protein [Pseudomonadota bacterium]